MNKHYVAAVLLAVAAVSNSHASENIPFNQFSGLIEYKPKAYIQTNTDGMVTFKESKEEGQTEQAEGGSNTEKGNTASEDNKKEAQPVSTYIANDEDKFLGDGISFPVNTVGYLGGKPCLLPHRTGEWYSIGGYRALGFNKNNYLEIYSTEDITCLNADAGRDKLPSKIPSYTTVEVYPEIERINRYGWTYGALLVPYKYYVSAEEFKANASIGPYFGYRFDPTGSFGMGFKFIVFGGGTIIEVDNDSGGTSNVAGLSYGAGLIGSVKRSFQFGIVAGEDRVSKSEDFDLNGKTWIAFAFGYNFTN